ncbi:pyridoxal phosphate-dependent aminotransferase [Streptomyces goshikiensis]|uniref:pyridoxal phosphate-dependent aminotransferase n=1 Tax=Streptomyces goshikiensis TaxID=1942 RepID=UPI0036561F72
MTTNHQPSASARIGREVAEISWNESLIHQLEIHHNTVDYSSYQGGTVHMISSGVNYLRPPSVILRSIAEDARDWKYINCYCGPIGESILRSGALVYEESLKGSPLEARVDTALTVGAAEGVRLSFDFLHRVHGAEKVLVAGPQYSIVHQTILSAGLTFHEVFTDREGIFLPGPAEIEAALDASGATVLFLTEPNNPSGEQHSEAEFDEIIGILKRRGTYLVLDKVSADFPAHPDIRVLNYGAALDLHDYWDRTLVVDGLAKRRAVSGLRFGYAMGSPEFIEFIENQRFGGCPPLVAVSGIARDLAYSAHLRREQLGSGGVSEALWQRFKGLNDASHELLAVRDTSEVEEYRLELLAMYQTIADNRRLAQHTLRPWQLAATELHAGFNYLACIPGPDSDPLAFGRRLYDESLVSCFPLACFTADTRLAAAKSPAGAHWLRITCASDRPVFEAQVEALRTFLADHA